MPCYFPMIFRKLHLVCLLWTGLIVALTAAASADEAGVAAKLPPAAGGEVDFARDVQPIFRARCYSCHGPDAEEGGLRLDLKVRALDGGDNGPVVKPGQSAVSKLVHLVAEVEEGERMPPLDQGAPLDDKQIGLVRAWIDQGAVWPDDAPGAIAAQATSDHWAFQPIADVEPPQLKDAGWVRSGIDAFILGKLEAEGVAPSPAADRPTLIRRLYLDLVGLPPTPAEVDEFMGDERPDAYEQLVKRVLASPHYGERWGRHWLDVARYADSDGFEKDRPRPHAWRWRDWVIEALNDDLPFDQFTIQQLAGDLLSDATLDTKVATGFHRNTLVNTEGGTDKEEDRVKRTVDRTNTLGEAWLGLTVGCAQCHTHKYDPLSHREYYGLYAFFNSLGEPDIPAPRPDELDAYKEAKAAFDREHAKYTSAVTQYEQTKLAAAQQSWEASLGEKRDKLPEDVKTALATAADQRSDEQRSKIAAHYRTIDPELKKLKQAANEHTKQAPPNPRETIKAQVVAELGTPRQTHILVRGNFLEPGAAVQRATPAVLHELTPRGETPDRLDLAHWLVDPDNPLTARVVVNRIWQRYFGRGIVPSSNDFGTQGDPPSHPELLDWLARRFIESGWRLKELHRLIVTSSTYRQSSAARPELAERDPYNAWLARQNRLRVQAEIVRDVALATSGLLKKQIGGPSVRPPQPAGIEQLGYAGSVKWPTSKGQDRYRRGLYTFFQRTVPYPMLMTFDSPDSNTACTRRERSNTPLQSLTLWNDPVFVECAQALGRRIVQESPGLEEDTNDAAAIDARIRYAYKLCFAREPAMNELEVVRQLYQEQLALCRSDEKAATSIAGASPNPAGVGAPELAAWVIVGRTLMNLDEFITKE